MFEKTLDQMQDLSKQWAAASRRVTREALRATSASLESAARYLHDLGDRIRAEEQVVPRDDAEDHGADVDDGGHGAGAGNGRAAGAAG